MYGITDVGLAKICRRNNIPVPPRGFWARRQAGYKVDVISLPRQARNQTITINPHPASNVASLPEELKMARQVIQSSLVIPENLQDPHPLVAKAAKVLSARKPDEKGRVHRGSARVLDIRVSPDQLERALRIFNAIIGALESQGYEVLISDSGTSIMAEGIQVFFSISEQLKATPREPTKWERNIRQTRFYAYTPLGKLMFSIHQPEVDNARKNWREGKKKIKDNLANFIVKLIDYGILARRQEEERRERQRRWEEEWRRRIEREEQIRREKEKFAELNSFVQNWQQSESIRQFADAVHKKMREDPEFIVDEEWLAWVRKQADRLDPLKNNSPLCAHDNDREE